ncbi:MAG: hypothetical protein A3G37_00850 [Omnitrophica WOR_2 bacterium RIFCSPLOWO2_12_FULL_46_30]|nr:MAG: hypothetical protein A3G37_00850 [Omnitrophica WOR_2 bacterium RIFCSPLOWO2_12_FULL_46_30]
MCSLNMQNLEELIKKSLKKSAGGAKRSIGCPAELKLAKYLEGSLPSNMRQDIEKHLADCPFCLDLLVVTRNVLNGEGQAKPSGFRRLRMQKWLILTGISFALSFVIRRFFLQFLFLSLILGIKWALSSEGSRNLVMIFRSLSHRGAEDKEERKIFERK